MSIFSSDESLVFDEESSESKSDESDVLELLLSRFYHHITGIDAETGKSVLDQASASRIYEAQVQLHIKEYFLINGFDAWFDIISRNEVQMPYDLMVKVRGVSEPFRCIPYYVYLQVKNSSKYVRKSKKKGAYKNSIKKGIFEFSGLTKKDILEKYSDVHIFCFYVSWDESDNRLTSRCSSIYIVHTKDLLEYMNKSQSYNLHLNINDPFWIDKNNNFNAIIQVAVERWIIAMAALTKLHGVEKTKKMIEQNGIGSITNQLSSFELNKTIMDQFEKQSFVIVKEKTKDG